MGNLNIDNAAVGTFTNVMQTYSPTDTTILSPTGQKESFYQNTKVATYTGYIREIPDIKGAELLKTTWNVGKGYTTDNRTQAILDLITGNGKQNFDDIIANADFTANCFGESATQVIRMKKDGTLSTNVEDMIVNMKALDIGTIRAVYNNEGILLRFEQWGKAPIGKVRDFKPQEIFYLVNNPVMDSMGGMSDFVALEETIAADMESFRDIRKIMHYQARPFIMWKLKTDDVTKINSFISRIEQARKLGEDTFIPDEDDTVSYEIVQLTLSPIILEWRNEVRNRIYRTIGVAQVIAGASGQGTESDSKVIYLAGEQTVEKRQRFLERQIESQLGLSINFYPPATMAQDLQRDTSKDPNTFQPNDVTAGVGV